MNMPAASGALRTWIELYAPTTEAPAEAHLGAALALISAAIGWKAHVRWGENSEPCTVNVVLEGRSATARKTTVAGGAHSIAREAMEKEYEEARGLNTRSISHTSSRGLVEVVAPKDVTQAARWETEPPPGTLLVWDEFGSVLGDPRDIKGAGWLGQVRATLMQFTGGRHGGIQTGADKIPPARCAVSVLATMTRVELEQRVSTGILRDGFMGRFLLIPSPGRTDYIASPPPWTAHMVEQRASLVDWIRTLAQTSSTIGDIFERLSPEGLACRELWYMETARRLENNARIDGDEGSAAAVEAFGRLQTAALKVATVAAVSEWDPRERELAEVTIERRHIEYGHALAMICLNEIIDLGKIAGLPARDVYAERVKGYLTDRGPVTKRQLLDNLRRPPGIARGEAWRVIEDLHPDVVEIRKVDTGGRPRLIVLLVEDDDPPPQNGATSQSYAGSELPAEGRDVAESGGQYAGSGPPAEVRDVAESGGRAGTYAGTYAGSTNDAPARTVEQKVDAQTLTRAVQADPPSPSPPYTQNGRAYGEAENLEGVERGNDCTSSNHAGLRDTSAGVPQANGGLMPEWDTSGLYDKPEDAS